MHRSARVLFLVAFASLAGCSWIDAATADRPSARQADAMGDIFGSVGAFVSVVKDPTSASDDDFEDMHSTAAYGQILDPEAASARRVGGGSNLVPSDCVTGEAGAAAWDCDVSIAGQTCHVVGSGQDNGDGTYGGTSTQTCAGTLVRLTATDLAFDEVSGTGGGVLLVAIGTGEADISGHAEVTLDDIGFCLGEDPVAPDSGSMTVDGLGALDGAPFDPLTLSFHDTPACGAVEIE